MEPLHPIERRLTGSHQHLPFSFGVAQEWRDLDRSRLMALDNLAIVGVAAPRADGRTPTVIVYDFGSAAPERVDGALLGMTATISQHPGARVIQSGSGLLVGGAKAWMVVYEAPIVYDGSSVWGRLSEVWVAHGGQGLRVVLTSFPEAHHLYAPFLHTMLATWRWGGTA